MTVFSFFIAFWIAHLRGAELVVPPERRAVWCDGDDRRRGRRQRHRPGAHRCAERCFSGRVDGDPLRPALALMLALLLGAAAALAAAMRAYATRLAPVRPAAASRTHERRRPPGGRLRERRSRPEPRAGTECPHTLNPGIARQTRQEQDMGWKMIYLARRNPSLAPEQFPQAGASTRRSGPAAPTCATRCCR